MNVIDSEDSFINEWKKVFLWIEIVLAVFSTLLLSNFISLSMLPVLKISRKKPVDAIRSI